MEARNYRAAAVEGERIFFHAPERITRMRAILARTWALKHLGEYELAFENLRRISPGNLPAELQYRIHHERVLLLFLKEDWIGVLAEADRLRNRVEQRDWQLLSGYLHVLALVHLERYDVALEEMNRYFEALGLQAVEHFPVAPADSKNPRKAAWLSTFLPGTGQIYAGKTAEGLGSTGLQAAALGWGIYNILTGYYVTALFTGGGLFQAFYFGGIDRAHHHALIYNRQAEIDFIQEITNWFLDYIEPALMQKRQTLSDSPFSESSFSDSHFLESPFSE